MSASTDHLWQRYRDHGDLETRAELLGLHIGLVHHVVRQVASRVGDAVPFEDLIGAGMLGLVQALEGFDLSREVAFTTYATQRIRGSVLDELRAADPRTRLLRNRARQIQAAEKSAHQQLGRPGRAEEIAALLEITVDEYWEWRSTAMPPTTVPIDGPVGGGEHSPSLADVIPSPNTPLPDAELLKQEQIAALEEAIGTLPEQQRLVLSLCYLEALTLRQIAEILHVTESRISQVRTAALKVLRERLNEDDFR